jgi:hypothetical protein
VPDFFHIGFTRYWLHRLTWQPRLRHVLDPCLPNATQTCQQRVPQALIITTLSTRVTIYLLRLQFLVTFHVRSCHCCLQHCRRFNEAMGLYLNNIDFMEPQTTTVVAHPLSFLSRPNTSIGTAQCSQPLHKELRTCIRSNYCLKTMLMVLPCSIAKQSIVHFWQSCIMTTKNASSIGVVV